MKTESGHASHGHNEHTIHDGHGGHRDAPESQMHIEVEWTSYPKQIESNQETEISLLINDPFGKGIPSLSTVHEKEMHLLAIKRDLTIFRHLHPTNAGDGRFLVKTTFPKPGIYKLYADFQPEGANQQLVSHELIVEGKETFETVKPDEKMQKNIGGLHFELVIPNLKVDQHIKIVFNVTDGAYMPIFELEPYLGSAGHVVIVSEDLGEFLHVHPTDETTSGPAVEYITTFPREGLYKIWGQFKYKGEIYTVPFVVDVEK